MIQLRGRLWRAVTIVVAALVGGLLTAALLPDHARTEGYTAGRPESTRLPAEQRSSQPEAGVTPARPTSKGPPSRPTAVPRLLEIPRLGLQLPVVPRGVDKRGAMALPTTNSEVAWYRFGSRPLDRAGATVLAGHVDTRTEGVGPLAGLAALQAGDLVEVRAGRHLVTYRTTSVTRISKALIDLPAVFSRAGPSRLHLVTCGGVYQPERGGYQDNVVVSARKVASGR